MPIPAGDGAPGGEWRPSGKGTKQARRSARSRKASPAPIPVDQRVLSVTILADLYRVAGRRPDDEEKLLQREMNNPQIKSSPEDLQTITARHDLLAKEGADSRQLSQAVDHWLQKHKPAWYDFAEPKIPLRMIRGCRTWTPFL